MRSGIEARYFAGFPIGFNLVVGGRDAKGGLLENELSFLFLEAQREGNPRGLHSFLSLLKKPGRSCLQPLLNVRDNMSLCGLYQGSIASGMEGKGTGKQNRPGNRPGGGADFLRRENQSKGARTRTYYPGHSNARQRLSGSSRFSICTR